MRTDARRAALVLGLAALGALAGGAGAYGEPSSGQPAGSPAGRPEAPERPRASSALSYFASDEGAFPGEPLAALAVKGYCLGVEAEGGTETRILFRDGLEIERRVARKTGTGSLESLYKGGLLREERRSGPRGELLEELFYFESGLLRERLSYRYEEGRLVLVEAFDGSGARTGSLSYRYDARGRLAELAAEGGFGEGRTGLVGIQGEGPSAEWSSLEGELSLRRFDAQGRVASVETRKGDAILRRETFAYEGSSARPRLSLLEDTAAGESVEKAFDPEGRPLRLRLLAKGAERSRTEYAYDDQGRLSSERTKSGAAVVLRSLSYDSEGGLLREETRKDGLLFRVVSFEGGGRRVEEYYEGEALVLRATYEGARKLRDEFFEGGQVARVRNYP